MSAAALIRFAESLDEESRRMATEAAMLALAAALRARFRKQAKAFRAHGSAELERAWELNILGDAELAAAARTALIVDSPRFAQRYTDLMQRAYVAGARIAGAELGADVPAVGVQPRAALTLTSEIDNTTVDRVSSTIKNSFEQQLSRGEMQQAVGELFKDWAGKQAKARAEGIAVNEISGAFHNGMMAAARASGAKATKHWITDSDPCPICEANAGEEIALDEPFASGDDAPPVHPFCRCSIAFGTAE